MPDPKKKKPIITNDPGDPRLHKYLDSLALYNAYRKQLQINPEQDFNKSDAKVYKPQSEKDLKNFKNKSNKERLNYFKDVNDYWKSEKEFKKDVPEDSPLIDEYKKLTFSEPTKTGLWTTPDLQHKSIAPTNIYFGGNNLGNAAVNPVYKKPNQPIQYSGNPKDLDNYRSTPTIIGTNTKFNPKNKISPINNISRQKINPLQNNLQPAGLILSDTNISADINTLRPNVINPKFYKIHEEHGNGNTTDYQVSDVNNINTDQNRKQIITPQFAYGGNLNNNMNSNQLTEFNEGGSHEQNPLGGIPQGTSNDGNTNMVEQGETKNGNYIYSNRLSVSSDLVKQMFLPNYIKNKSFADASKSINDKFKDRNDTHSNTTKKELLDRLTQAQESVKAQQEQINQAIQANSQQIPDQMNGEIPEGMEQFAEGGYYDNNNPYFSQDVMNPGTNPMGPYNQTPISLPSPAGLSKLSNPGLSAPTDMGLSAGLTPAKGLLDAGVQSAVGSFAPGIGAVQGAIGLNELAKGNGASRNKIGSAATGAMTGAMAGAGFGPAGMIALGTIGAIAGGIGSGNRREQDAELGSLNAKNANNVFRDKRYAAYGGPLLNKNPMKGIAANAYNTYNTPISDGTLDDFALTSDLVNQYKLKNPVGPVTDPSLNRFPNNFGEPNRFNREINPTGYSNYNSYANLGQSDNLYQKPKSNFLTKLGSGINNNTVGNALRLAPVAMNAYQLAKLKKPGIQSLSRLSNTYKPQYLDEATLQNAVGNENRNTINALTNSSGGSEAALRAGILGAGLNATRGRSDAYMKMRDYNNQQNIAGQQFQLGVDQANMSQSNLEMDINDKNQGNYDTQKSKLIGQIGTDLGSIGKEKLFADKAGKMFGYDENGKYILTPEGKKSYISDSEESTSLTDEQKAYLKTMPKAFGGYLRTNKKGY